VDARGGTVETASGSPIAETVEAKTTKDLSPGAYYVRLYLSGSNDVAREFALIVE
jgi:hypothetical protein